MKRLSLLSIPLLAVLMVPMFAAGESCPVPPSGSLSLAKSKDSFWRAKWCSNQSMIDTLWNGLGMNETWDLWDEGWGYGEVCDDSKFLSRLLNAAFIVREVQKSATRFGENRGGPPPVLPDWWMPINEWWDFVKTRDNDGYEPKCCNSEPGLLATHWGFGGSTDLCIKWGYKVAAAPRSSTLVHEATHEDVGHIGDDECTNNGSCDTYYGDYNATTMQINYLYDAISAYEVETVNNVVQRKISRFTAGSKEMCQYIPLFDEGERTEILDEIEYKIDHNFAYGSVFVRYSDIADVDLGYNTPWECKSCNLSDFTFTPGVNNKACNEVMNPANAGINASMRDACTNFIQKISTSPGAEAYEAIHTEFVFKTAATCLPYDPAAVHQYCENQQKTAATVDDLDPYGWLSSNGYNEEFNCAANFCQEKFQGSWAAHAGDPNWDDPRGCLDLLCGNDAKCRKRFLTYKGDPDYYQASVPCFDNLLTCYEDHGAVYQPGTSVTTPELKACEDRYKSCVEFEETKKRFLGLVLAKKWEVPGPGPVEKFKSTPWMNPVAQAFQTKMMQLKARIDKGLGERELNLEMRRLMAPPESIAALYQFDAPGFVALFGKERYLTTVGPSILRIKPRAFRMKELDVRSKALFENIRKMDHSVRAIQE